MADYHYDESGNMAAYFLITFLFVVLVPLTLSSPAAFSTCHTRLLIVSLPSPLACVPRTEAE